MLLKCKLTRIYSSIVSLNHLTFVETGCFSLWKLHAEVSLVAVCLDLDSETSWFVFGNCLAFLPQTQLQNCRSHLVESVDLNKLPSSIWTPSCFWTVLNQPCVLVRWSSSLTSFLSVVMLRGKPLRFLVNVPTWRTLVCLTAVMWWWDRKSYSIRPSASFLPSLSDKHGRAAWCWRNQQASDSSSCCAVRPHGVLFTPLNIHLCTPGVFVALCNVKQHRMNLSKSHGRFQLVVFLSKCTSSHEKPYCSWAERLASARCVFQHFRYFRVKTDVKTSSAWLNPPVYLFCSSMKSLVAVKVGAFAAD